MKRPEANECDAYFHSYIDKFQGDDLIAEFESQPAALSELLSNLPEGEDAKLHQPYTWTLKQVMGHLIDTERIFATRLLRIAASDPTPNPGFEQNDYVDNFDYKDVPMQNLLEEFSVLRKASAMLVRRCSDQQLSRKGTSSGKEMTARAAFFLMGGHVAYHEEIMRKRLAGQEA